MSLAIVLPRYLGVLVTFMVCLGSLFTEFRATGGKLVGKSCWNFLQNGNNQCNYHSLSYLLSRKKKVKNVILYNIILKLYAYSIKKCHSFLCDHWMFVSKLATFLAKLIAKISFHSSWWPKQLQLGKLNILYQSVEAGLEVNFLVHLQLGW